MAGRYRCSRAARVAPGYVPSVEVFALATKDPSLSSSRRGGRLGLLELRRAQLPAGIWCICALLLLPGPSFSATPDLRLGHLARRRQAPNPLNRKSKDEGRNGMPCFKPECWLPHHYHMQKHEAWVPKAYGYLDRPGYFRPNLHNEKNEGKELPWVVPRKRSGTPDSFTEKHWTRLRPRHAVHGPRSLSCQSVEPFKFYLMVEAMVPSCNFNFDGGQELLDAIDAKTTTKGTGQHLGELFFYWQLRNHTWRTFDPMEAQLVVVPIFGTLLSRGVCGPLDPALGHIASALEAFPRFQVNHGKDFMMMATDFKPQASLFGTPLGKGGKLRFNIATRNFIYASRLNGKFIKLRSIQGHAKQNTSRCVLPVPYTSAHDLIDCKGDQDSGLLSCPGLQEDMEKTFEEFMGIRNITLFFMGQADPRVAYQSRRILVTQVAFLNWRRSPGPNYVVGSVSLRGVRPPHPVCSRERSPMTWNGCFFSNSFTPGNSNRKVYQMKLINSRLSIMAGGDDPTTSRFYDALAHGTPQIIISEGWYDQGAPFRCAVDHRAIAYHINEVDFQSAPAVAMNRAMTRLLDEDYRRLRAIWEAQKAAAPDLLWHVPGSRVTQNVLEDVYRKCLTDRRGNNDLA